MSYKIFGVLLIVGCGNANWAAKSKPPCETHQVNYEYTTIACGDYYSDAIIICDENNNYYRGIECLNLFVQKITQTAGKGVPPLNFRCRLSGCE